MIVGRMERTLRFVRYLRRLPPKMVFGKVVQLLKIRFVRWRIWVRAQGVLKVAGFHESDALRGFGGVFKLEGDRLSDNSALALSGGSFSSDGYVHNFGGLSEVEWGAVLLESPELVRWEHDFAFFTFVLPLANDSEQSGAVIAALLEQMEAKVHGRRDLAAFEWCPIALAFRIMSLASYLALVSPSLSRHRHEVDRSIARHIELCGRLLSLTVERYLGYNHAVFTECGLVVYALSRGDHGAAREGAKRAFNVLERHTLPDGMWSERSPTYHLHMLVMLRCLIATELLDEDHHSRAGQLDLKMTHAMSVLVHPDGEIAVFNDAAIGDAPAPRLLGWDRGQAGVVAPVLDEAGYVRIDSGPFSVLMDAGPMGPADVVGHGHADFLAIEVVCGTQRLVVDPGVESITPGRGRERTRSSASHNGPAFCGSEPAEFFGAWRVGWSGTAQLDGVAVAADGRGVLSASGSCDGWSKRDGSVARTVSADNSSIKVVDSWEGPATLERRSNFLVPQTWGVSHISSSRVVFSQGTGQQVQWQLGEGDAFVITESAYYPSGPASRRDAWSVVVTPQSGRMELVISEYRK